MERDAPDGRRVRRAWTVLLAVCLAWTAAAQRRVGLAYYDLGALYDTVPSLFYDDGDYTPAGSRHWTAERYGATLSRLASVLDSLAMPLVGLYGVETERAALDLAARSGATTAWSIARSTAWTVSISRCCIRPTGWSPAGWRRDTVG